MSSNMKSKVSFHSIESNEFIVEHFFLEMAGSVTGKVAGNISSVYSIIRQKTHDIHDTFESLAMGNDHQRMVRMRHCNSNRIFCSSICLQKSFPSLSTQSSNSTSEENVSVRSNIQQETLDFESLMANTNESLSPRSLSAIDQEEQLVYLVTNILFTVLWRGVDNNGGDSWKVGLHVEEFKFNFTMFVYSSPRNEVR